MNCTICGKRIILMPSAKARADKYGGSPKDYIRLFTSHAECAINKREAETIALMHRIANKDAWTAARRELEQTQAALFPL